MKLGTMLNSVFSIPILVFILSNSSESRSVKNLTESPFTGNHSTSNYLYSLKNEILDSLPAATSIIIEGLVHKMKDVSILIGTLASESEISAVLVSGQYVQVTDPRDIKNNTIYQSRLYRVFKFIEPATVIQGIKGKTVRLTLIKDGRNYLVTSMEII